MKIEIETDGSPEGTTLLLNGRPQPHFIELEFTVNRRRPGRGRPCLHLVQGTAERPLDPALSGFTRYFGNDFQKYDEYYPAVDTKAVPGVGA